MAFKLNVGFVGFLNKREYKKYISCVRDPNVGFELGIRHLAPDNPTFPDISPDPSSSPEDTDSEFSNDCAVFNDPRDANIQREFPGTSLGSQKADKSDKCNDSTGFSGSTPLAMVTEQEREAEINRLAAADAAGADEPEYGKTGPEETEEEARPRWNSGSGEDDDVAEF
jgi:hypothetical protein